FVFSRLISLIKEGKGSSLSLNVTAATSDNCERLAKHSCCVADNLTRDLLHRLFADGYRADVSVYTNDGIILAHASILVRPLPPIFPVENRSTLTHCDPESLDPLISCVCSDSYEEEEMNEFVLHLLVLSHAFVIPSLKKVCVQQLERGLLTTENVVDALQLARLCDAPRLCLLCHRLIVKQFNEVSASGGWKVLRQSDPVLEKELLESVTDDDSVSSFLRKIEERKIYLQLHEAMEALVHICRDGCRTIGPHDKVLKQNAAPCNFPACKGLEALVRHFAGCKNRVLGGCIHCKRMWQLLELHSRLCSQVDGCKVPLCRHFKEKLRQQSKKDEVKWKLLVSKVMEAKDFSATRVHSSVVVVCTQPQLTFH
ncbi:hypothetical protein BHM03_00053149, partial [Ensete ventricosum]